MKRVITLILLSAVCSLGFSQSKIPSVKLKTLDNKTVNLSEYNDSDKIVVVSFWATWCGPCMKELDAIKKHYEKWQKELDVEILAVTIDNSRTKNKVKPLVKSKGWKYKVLMDTNQEFKRGMNVGDIPYTAVFYKGKKVYTHSSYSKGFEKELYKELKSIKK